jgi:hypothetical protein
MKLVPLLRRVKTLFVASAMKLVPLLRRVKTIFPSSTMKLVPLLLQIKTIFLVSGFFSLVFSIFSNSQVLAFIGLGLVLWGAILFLARPEKYVEIGLLDSVSVSEYSTIDRIIRSLNFSGKGYYVPSYPQDRNLPEHLKGLKDMVVFLSPERDADALPIEEIIKGEFLLSNSKGALVAPPGLGILTQVERRLGMDFARVALGDVGEVLPRFLTQDLNLAKSMQLTVSEKEAHLKIFDSAYKSLYPAENCKSSFAILGCPISSAVACALAKASGKMVTVQRQMFYPDGLTVEVVYGFR